MDLPSSFNSLFDSLANSFHIRLLLDRDLRLCTESVSPDAEATHLNVESCRPDVESYHHDAEST
ncbi:hypothetical protein MA16_Dca023426 [Dendrobium catenatum]|uniref:Uncharacterized protein n=1 Tax=Dendrobium catenatum TaxID=906689 RepID=A0A2I0W6N3_9ASPA|nr:hypothetical protein MA16_Dca023426 [Dendrobium catenatum]